MKDGLTSDFALSIFEDKNEKLWFGMANGSVYHFNGKEFQKQFKEKCERRTNLDRWCTPP
jgi:hypothetical protein